MLQGRAAVITGSTSGIGLAIARALAGEGANVVLNGFGDPGSGRQHPEGPGGGRRPRERRRRRHVEAGGDRGDDGVCAGKFGSVDILVTMPASSTCAGRGLPGRKWDAIIAINLSSALPHDAPGAAG